MPIDWGKLIEAGTQVAAPIIGAVAGSKAQGAGIQNSGQNLRKAYDVAGKAYTGSLQAAQPYYNWAYNQGLNNLNYTGGKIADVAGRQFEGVNSARDWGYDQAGNLANWAYGQGQGTRANALNQSLTALQSGYGGASQNLQPYAASGINALNDLNRLTFGARSQFKPAQAPSRQPLPQFQLPQMQAPPWQQGGGPGQPMMRQTSPFGETASVPQQSLNSMAPPSGGGFGGGAGGGMGGAGGSLANLNLQDNRVNGPGMGAGLAGSLVSGLGSMAATGGLGAAAGAALGGFAGPIGMAAGALIGPLVGRLTRKGREKKGASLAVNEVSDWIKTDVMPLVQSGQMTPAQGRQVIEQGWSEYSNWLNSNLKDKGVVQNSLSSQRAYLDNGWLRDLDNMPQGGQAAPGSLASQNAVNPNWWQMAA